MPRGGVRVDAGRPRGSVVSDRTEFLHVRVTSSELERWGLAASDAGWDLSNWVRRALDAASDAE